MTQSFNLYHSRHDGWWYQSSVKCSQSTLSIFYSLLFIFFLFQCSIFLLPSIPTRDNLFSSTVGQFMPPQTWWLWVFGVDDVFCVPSLPLSIQYSIIVQNFCHEAVFLLNFILVADDRRPSSVSQFIHSRHCGVLVMIWGWCWFMKCSHKPLVHLSSSVLVCCFCYDYSVFFASFFLYFVVHASNWQCRLSFCNCFRWNCFMEVCFIFCT